ncbi:MAG TPA: chromosome partitioning protein ParA, partial [Leptospiraceae bacterium]|nr:chromosome partitioning protein ParA [Leptospiraceae bacterium]
MKIIILSSLKGGVGKTAISIHLALELRKRHNVVFLDLDPQASATDFLLRDTDIDQLDRRGALQLLT